MWYQLLLCLFIMLLLWYVKDDKKRTKYILPLGFIIITIFFALRYEYGNDYWHYFQRWDSGSLVEGDNRGTGETLFYQFMQLFDHYYKFVIVHTIVFCSIMFYMVRRYITPKYYAFFIFIFMTMSTMSYNMMSAMRSTMAACVLWLAFDLFYIRKKRWLPFAGMVILSGFFHTSALMFILIPLIDRWLRIVKPNILFAFLCVGIVVNVMFSKELYAFLLSFSSTMSDTYGGYLDIDKTSGASIFGMLNRSIMLFPYYFICMKKEHFNQENKSEIWILAMFIITLICFGLDIDGRFSLVLYIFVIISLSIVIPSLNKSQRIYCLVPLVVYIVYNHIYLFYKMQLLYYYTNLNNGDGCFLYYTSIFDAPFLP